MPTSKFQLVFIGLLIVAIVGAVFLFSQDHGQTVGLSDITIWGTLPEAQFSAFAFQAMKQNPNLAIHYAEKRPETFDQDLVEALASGKGPDVVIFPQDLLLRHQDKIYPIPYTSLSERDFKDTYIQEAELYLTPEGSLSLPFTVDPMVMYWNRDMFANASVSVPPKLWDEFYDLADKLTVKNEKLEISKSAVALGEYQNITHAKELLAALMLQAGTQITKRDQQGDMSSVINSSDPSGTVSAVAALSFFTQFSNPVKSFYSWNKSLPDSKDMFLAGDLATYIGFASEYQDLKLKNPNLNFDVAAIPQAVDSPNKITYANLLGFAILRVSPHITDAFKTIIELTSKENIAAWSQTTRLPPVRRDLLLTPPTDALGPIFYNSALWSRGWLDPNPAETANIFKEMVENVGSGRARVNEAVRTADDEIDNLLK